MQVANCKGCGRLFNVMGSEKICPNCQKKLEDKFDEVKKFIEDNPNSSVEVVAKETEVSMKQIRKWIREERLTLSEASEIGIECESCGKLIKTGRFCDECKANLTNTLGGMIKKPKEPEVKKTVRDGNRMRFLQSDR